MTPERISEILEKLSGLPDTAVVPVEVAAAHDNVSARTVRRTYPTVQLSPGRKGVKVAFLRTRAA